MEHIPSLEVYISRASLEIFRIFRNPKIQHRAYKCQRLVPALRLINPFLTSVLFIEDQLYYTTIYA